MYLVTLVEVHIACVCAHMWIAMHTITGSFEAYYG